MVFIDRPMVKTIYQPPQVTDDDEFEALVVKYMTDYRRIYIEHPRVRYDGVYIAVCHYMYVNLPRMLSLCIKATDLVVTALARMFGSTYVLVSQRQGSVGHSELTSRTQ